MGQIDELWRYDGRRVVVTGCASGIGAHVARQLGELGAEVIGLDLPATGRRAQGVSRGRPCRPRVDRQAVAPIDGPIDSLFNVAGVSSGIGDPLLVVTDQLPGHATFHRVADRRMAAGIGDRAACPRSRHRPTSRTRVPWPVCWTPPPWTRASRGATTTPMHSPTAATGWPRRRSSSTAWRTLCALGAKGIRINCTAPGVTETPILDQLRTAYGQAFLDTSPSRWAGCPTGRAGGGAGIPEQPRRQLHHRTGDLGRRRNRRGPGSPTAVKVVRHSWPA